MTIDEAISHALEVAERQEYLSQNYHEYVEEKWNVKKRNKCAECAADHRQLAKSAGAERSKATSENGG